MTITDIVNQQRAFFRTGATLPISYRKQALNKLKKAIQTHEKELLEALHTDLGKSEMEAYMCEVGLTISEINYISARLRRWARNKRVCTPLANFPAKSFTVQEPYGVTLIMSPWNYPVLLTLEPLVGAIAAGNCCVLKPSDYSPATSKVIASLIAEIFPPEYVTVVTGGRKENTDLLEQHFDYIFFTGGVTVGKLVMEKAAQHLTPITLELGGKSPCIVDKTANIPLAARRIVFGKYLNCGQTCIAPDYILIDESVHDEFVTCVKKEIAKMYKAPLLSPPQGGSCHADKASLSITPDYGKIINRKHFDRILGLIDPAKVVYGGGSNAETLQIEPTVLDNVTLDDAVMQEEIFGPIMPIIVAPLPSPHEGGKPFADWAIEFIRNRPAPLALYVFTNDKKTEKRFLKTVQFGGGCVNDTIMHLATSEMAFGGVGNSGMGSYHGKKSFETFSHEKSIVKKPNWIDLPIRYQPYTSLKQWLVRLFLG